MTDTFFADISEFQPYVNDSYPHEVISMRGDSGWRTDNHFSHNFTWAQRSSKLKICIVYVVCIPGQVDGVMTRLKEVIGKTCPKKVVFMVDMESGDGFAGPGNHSVDGNKYLEELAAYAGSQKRVLAYANHGDYQNNWPQLVSWAKKITAAYGTSDPGTYGWQYCGGNPAYPSPTGYPRSCAPFGSRVDMNVVHRSVATMLKDFDIATTEDWLTMATEAQIDAKLSSLQKAIHDNFYNLIYAMLRGKPAGEYTKKEHPHIVDGVGILERLKNIEADVEALKAAQK